MGVDPIMMVVIPKPMTDREIIRASYEMCEAFGPGKFYQTETLHALTRAGRADDWWKPETAPPEDSTLLAVSLPCRYWGPGYERGDFPLLYMLSLYLERKYGATVYYDGDTGGPALPVFGHAEREKFLSHFAEVGNRPYYTRTLSFDRPKQFGTVFCDFCQEPFGRYGWGRNYGTFYCSGCGERRVTHDAGATWTITKGEY